MTARTGIRTLAWLLILLMALPPAIFAQPMTAPEQGQTAPQAAGPPAPVFAQEELDQMLAPIALYPDALLAQVLMAATYPMEVVTADRWVSANRSLSGDQLAAALEQQGWDPSVKSLANFPSVLAMMDQRLDWTQKLGDAFLSQQDQVMATVQKLRASAQAQGTLQTTSQQRVVTDDQMIAIEPADPGVMYVPAYDPTVVYGPWWYPAYPPYPYYPVGAVIAGAAIFFGVGIALGVPWGYAWGGFDWRHRHTMFNVYQNGGYNRYINRGVYATRYGSGGHGAWSHDPGHRQGVAYRDNNLARRYGQTPRGNPDARRDFRGQGPGSTQAGVRQGGVQGPRGTPGVSPGVQSPRGPSVSSQPGIQRGPGALEGVGRGGSEARTQGDRGRSSRGTMTGPGSSAAPQTVNRPTGGGSRPAAGGGGGHPAGNNAHPR
jgi:hypothetical protein